MSERTKDARILVVDDEPPNVALLEAVLSRGGYPHVRSLTDPRAAESTIERWHPDLIVLDLHMPHIDGFELIRRIRERQHEPIPIMVLTADTGIEARRQALRIGARDCLTKPFDLDEVLLRIANALDSHFTHIRLSVRSERLEREVQVRTRDLEDARLEVLERLALAAEYRDDESHDHALRVGRTAALLAEQLGIAGDAISSLQRAAVLHDIGKIGVPDAILLKPGALDAGEFAAMREHTLIGAGILAGSTSRILQVAEQIARSHHERFDGSGYPDGLAAEQIPLVARIVTLADVFDALVHERPYKNAWPIARAHAEILDGAGRQFDPRIVAAFEHLDHDALLNPIAAPPAAAVPTRRPDRSGSPAR